MNLFDGDPIENLLPYNGTVRYYAKVLSPDEADRYLGVLLATIPWRQDEAVVFGKKYLTPRKVAWYGDRAFQYTYSNTTKTALPWTPELLTLKQLAESYTGTRYNSCLLNLYHHGEEGMAWHSDSESSLGKNTSIASFSFGAERKFAFRHKTTKEVRALVLEHGSLLEMKDETQSYWLHRLPPARLIKQPRVNLTFRTIVDQ